MQNLKYCSPRFWGGLYLSFIPLFAIIYTYKHSEFKHPDIFLENSFQLEKNRLAKKLDAKFHDYLKIYNEANLAINDEKYRRHNLEPHHGFITYIDPETRSIMLTEKNSPANVWDIEKEYNEKEYLYLHISSLTPGENCTENPNLEEKIKNINQLKDELKRRGIGRHTRNIGHQVRFKENRYFEKLKSCSESSICKISMSIDSNNISMSCKNPKILSFSNLENIEPSIKNTNTYILNWNNIDKIKKEDFNKLLRKIKRTRSEKISSIEMRKYIIGTSIEKEVEEIFVLATKNNNFIKSNEKIIYNHSGWTRSLNSTSFHLHKKDAVILTRLIKTKYELIDIIQEYFYINRGIQTRITWGAFKRMLYLSAVTITTLGYGDIVPNSDTTRFLVALQSVLGIIIIGLFINSVARSPKNGKS